MESNQRKKSRYLTKENAYASLGLGFTKVGEIKDICRNGMAFEYISYDETKLCLNQQVDIFVSQNVFHLANVSCSIIYDVPADTNYISPIFFKNFTYKRCGLQFMDMTEDQESKILTFLENHTKGTLHIQAT